MSVVGVVQCKNEWGLIAVSVTHALVNHCDAVWILNDGSVDETAAGLAVLQKKWGDRLRVIHLDSIGFEQEAITNTLVQIMRLEDSPRWIYPFDADEFLVCDGGRSLRDLLAEIPDGVDEVEYTVTNFVSPSDFDENSIADFRRQRYRAKNPRLASIQTKEREMGDGTSTFFDFEFMSKVIFRNTVDIRLDRGSHATKVFGRPKSSVFRTDLHAVHLPMLTRARIDRKAQQGKAHIDAGAPPGRGWQNQFLYRLQQEGRLDDFWSRHSIDSANPPDSVVVTNEFTEAIEPSLVSLRELFGSDDLRRVKGKKLVAGRAPQTKLGLDEVVRVSHALQIHASRVLRQDNLERRASTEYRFARWWDSTRKALGRRGAAK